MTLASSFTLQQLALNLEYLELELFNQALDQLSEDDWVKASYDKSIVDVIRFMRDQETAHVAGIQDLLDGNGPKACDYSFPWNDVESFIDFASVVTR